MATIAGKMDSVTRMQDEDEEIEARKTKIVLALHFPDGISAIVNDYAFDIGTRSWFSVGEALTEPIEGARSVISKDGRYLNVIGGWITAKYRQFDLKRHRWTCMPPMKKERFGLDVCQSPCGRYIYAVGGLGHEVGVGVCSLRSGEVFDQRTLEWSDLPSMHEPRSGHALTISNDGRYLYAIGGKFGLTNITRSVEVLDLHTREWSYASDLQKARGWIGTTATFTPDGNYIVTIGGCLPENPECPSSSSSETDKGDYAVNHHVGGINERKTGMPLSAPVLPPSQMPHLKLKTMGEVYDVRADKWRLLRGKSTIPRVRESGRAGLGIAMSPNGKKLFAVGGWSTANAEMYDLELQQWTYFQSPKISARYRRILRQSLNISPDGKWLYYVAQGVQVLRIAP